MIDKLSTQARLFIAIVLSMVFFVAYDYYFLPKKQLDQNSTSIEQNAQNTQNAPAIKQNAPDAQNAQNVPAQKQSKILVKISAPDFNASIDEFGRISNFILSNDKFKNEEGEQTTLIAPGHEPLPLEVRFANTELNNLAFKNTYSASSNELDLNTGAKSVILTQNLGDKTLIKEILFYPNGSYDLKVSVDADYFITAGHRPSAQVDGYTVHGTMLRTSSDSLEIIEDGDAKGDEVFRGIDLVASSDRYYTTLFYDENKNLEVYIQNAKDESTLAFIRASGALMLKGFIGPKNNELLKSINPRLSDVVEYGWFTFISKPMFAFLNWLYGYLGNWGWAIVVLTLIIRVILFPLTYKGMVSMNKLKDIAPKMRELQAKYKGDPAKLNAHMMELYKKHGANPMGGCLPILLQIPVFFAIYRVLLNAIELKGAEWILWVNDLAIKDPYFVLPILMGASMYLQQRITPTTFSDPMQEKLMRWLPVIFTFFFLMFPAGLTLYWFINNLCSLLQQYLVNKMFAKHKAEEIAAHKQA